MPPPAGGPVGTVEVIPESISWCKPRRLGDVYVALRAWQYLGLDRLLPRTALPELLDYPPARLSLNHLYRCLSLVEPHQHTIEQHLADQGRDLFHCTNDLLLYDLTSTYFEGRLEHNAKAQRGYSRDHRPDCKQLSWRPNPAV